MLETSVSVVVSILVVEDVSVRVDGTGEVIVA